MAPAPAGGFAASKGLYILRSFPNATRSRPYRRSVCQPQSYHSHRGPTPGRTLQAGSSRRYSFQGCTKALQPRSAAPLKQALQ